MDNKKRKYSGYGASLEMVSSFPAIKKEGDGYSKSEEWAACSIVYNPSLFFDHSRMDAWCAAYIGEGGFAVRFWAMDPMDCVLSLQAWVREQLEGPSENEEIVEDIETN